MKNKRKKVKKVTVLYNEVKSLPFSDKDALLTEEGGREDAAIIARALSRDGYKTEIFKLTPETVREVNSIRTDLIFNLCDGIGSFPRTEHKVPEILDHHQKPYTGANASSLILTTNKVLTKKVFEQNGIPTPSFAVFETVPQDLPSRLEFPLFVKPVAEDCSLGISANSVVTSYARLKKEVRNLLKKYHQPVLVEEYIAGRELNVLIIGNGREAKVLPISEIDFGEFYIGRPKFVDFKAKWVENSFSYKNTTGICPAPLSKSLQKKIENLALKAYFVCGGRDYARIDIRLRRDGIPYFLEVNLNCDLSPEMGASRSANTFGLDYNHFIGTLTAIAARRYNFLV